MGAAKQGRQTQISQESEGRIEVSLIPELGEQGGP